MITDDFLRIAHRIVRDHGWPLLCGK